MHGCSVPSKRLVNSDSEVFREKSLPKIGLTFQEPLDILEIGSRWAPSSYKWSYNLNGVVTPIDGLLNG